MLRRIFGRPSGGEPHIAYEAEDDLQFERVVFFSDAVFAIAMTLLIIDLRVPDNVEGDLISYLRTGALRHQILGFVISFLLIGTYWVAHNRHFKYIKRYDARLIWLNLFFLMSIVFLPFVTSLLGNYGDQRGAVALYAVSLSITGLLLALQWLHATDRNRLVDPQLGDHFIRYFTMRALLPPIVLLLSLGLLYLPIDGESAASLAEFSWLLIAVIRPVLSRIYGYKQ